MKLLNLLMLSAAALLTASDAAAQANASINVLTLNSGNVNQGSTVNIQVTVGNTGPVSSIGVYKIRTQVSVPSAICSILPNAQQTGLPAGWTINSNNGSTINLSNGTDVIPVGVQRTILIAVQGNTVGGPSTVSGQLSFSNGVAPGTGPGTLAGDNTADNSSTSSITVLAPTPVTLTGFSAGIQNCIPLLRWTTEGETNSSRFDIERSIPGSNQWNTAGTVAAAGNSTSRLQYSFTDLNLGSNSGKILYRLKMTDRDGSYRYSEILPVTAACNTQSVSVFPNPVQQGRLYISLSGATGHTEAALLTLTGQVISRTAITNGTSSIPVSQLPGGVYILEVSNKEGSSSKTKVLIGN